MANKELETAKEEFLNGNAESVRFGGYGGTVTVRVKSGSVHVQATKPKRKQMKIGPNSRTIREVALEVAEELIACLRRKPSARKPEVRTPSAARQAGLITPRDVYIAYLRRRLGPTMPEIEVLSWGRKALVAFMTTLSPAARRIAGSSDYNYSMLLAARRLDKDGVVPLDGDIEAIQPNELDLWATDHVGKLSEYTINTYLARFRTAVRKYMAKRPRDWGKREDPTAELELLSTEHIRPPDVKKEELMPLLDAMRELGLWRALATALVIDATARRVGSVSGGRPGLHMDATPFRAEDFATAEDGLVEVNWRAEVQKGKAYRRGDVKHPTTHQLMVVYRWLRWFHPNPLGSAHPLIWDEEDPTRAESYDRLLSDLGQAWRKAFGKEKPKGLGWHAFCRTMISRCAEEAGILATADFTGRSVKMVESTYRRISRESVLATARKLDAVRRRRHRSNGEVKRA
jgi:hypothetical protein